jgi:hypothetical protein
LLGTGADPRPHPASRSKMIRQRRFILTPLVA